MEPLLQTKRGKDATGMTAAEFEWLLLQLESEAETRAAGDPEAFPVGHKILSLDNCKPHRSYMTKYPAKHFNEIPSCSPDIHKVVEHPLKPFNDRWYTEFTLDQRCTTCESAMALASTVLHRTTPKSIENDIKTIPATLRSIVANRGDWADPKLS